MPWERLGETTPLSQEEPSVLFRRKFHRPTGLAPQDRVVLGISLGEGTKLSQLQLNSTALDLEREIEIQEHLEPLNVLEIALLVRPEMSQLPFDEHCSVELRIFGQA